MRLDVEEYPKFSKKIEKPQANMSIPNGLIIIGFFFVNGQWTRLKKRLESYSILTQGCGWYVATLQRNQTCLVIVAGIPEIAKIPENSARNNPVLLYNSRRFVSYC